MKKRAVIVLLTVLLMPAVVGRLHAQKIKVIVDQRRRATVQFDVDTKKLYDL